MKYLYILIILSIFGLFSCSSLEEPYYLRNKYVLIDDDIPAEKLTGISIPNSDSYDAIEIMVYDTLCFYYSWKNPNGFYSILNIKNGQELGTFCTKGRGPREATGLGLIFEFDDTDGVLRAEIMDIHKYRMFVWNITESLKTGKTVYDTIRPLSLHGKPRPYRWCCRIDDSQYFTAESPIPFDNLNQIIPPRYAVTSSVDNRTIREYEIFTDSIITAPAKRNWLMFDFTGMECNMKPDKSKVALGMANYPQINILDIKTGDVKGYRLKSQPDISVIKRIWYYSSVHCDNEFIYALYNAFDTTNNPKQCLKPSEVHVFDWNGKMVRKLELEQYFSGMWLSNNELYTFESQSGTLVRYAL